MATKINYTARMKAIKTFVSFSYKTITTNSKRLKRKQKYRITQYYNEVALLKNRPHKIYRTKNHARLTEAQSYAGQRHLKYMKTAFVPVASPKAKFKFKKGKLSVEEEHIDTMVIRFDPKNLAIDPRGEVEGKIQGVNAKSFNIMAGEFQIPHGYDANSLIDQIESYVYQYLGVKHHDVMDWLIGVRAHNFRNQKSYNKYRKDFNAAIQKEKEERVKQRKKRRG